jgi:branched-chain amino acid transport system substrate-binding protein
MRKNRRPLALLLSIVTGGLVAACGAGETGDVITVNIGYSGPLSGGAAFYGRNVQTGLQMAADELNERGEIVVDGRPVRFNIVSLDDRYLPNETATNVRRLVQQSRSPVIFIPHEGGIRTAQGLRDAEFLLMAYSSAPGVLEAQHPLTVMIPPRYDNYQEPFVRTMMQRFGTRLGVLPTTTTYGRSWTESLTAEWQRQGGVIGRNYEVDYNTTTDFSSVVTQVLAERPDVLFLGGPSQPTALIIRAAREQGFRGGFLLMDQPKFEEMVEVVNMAQLEGSVGVHPAETYPAPGTALFVADFRKHYGEDRIIVSEIALNYQALHIVARAMELAGTTTDYRAIRAHIADAVAQLPLPQQVSQIARVSPLGHLERHVFAAEVRDGQFVPIEIPSVR